MLTKNKIFNLTKALASSVYLSRASVRRILSNLYLTNNNNDSDDELIFGEDYPDRQSQAYDNFLDLIGAQFKKPRLSGETDEDYRVRIQFSIRQNTTNSGVEDTIKFLISATNINKYIYYDEDNEVIFDEIPIDSMFDVVLKKSLNDFIDLEETTFDDPFREPEGTLLYGYTVYIIPKNLQQTSVKVFNQITESVETKVYKYNNPALYYLDFVGNMVYTDDDGNPVGNQQDTETIVSEKDDSNFHRYLNFNYSRINRIFKKPEFRDIIKEFSASGVVINRVVVVNPGSSSTINEYPSLAGGHDTSSIIII